MTKPVCDRCNVALDEPPPLPPHLAGDFCQKCIESFAKWLDAKRKAIT